MNRATASRWALVLLAGAGLVLVFGPNAALGDLRLDVRWGATNTVAINGPTDVVTASLWVVATGANADTSDDGVQKFYAAYYSSNGGLVLGAMTQTFLPDQPLDSDMHMGTSQDLDGDGDNDVGGTNAASGTDWVYARAYTGGVIPSPIHFGTVTFSGNGWGGSPHGVTRIWGIGRPSSTYSAIWREDGVMVSGNASTGSEITLYRPAAADAGDGLSVGPGGSAILDGSRSVGTIDSWEWDLNGDGLADVTGETSAITYDYLATTLGLGQGDHTVTLRTTSPYTTSADTMVLTVLPEPGTCALLALGGLALHRARRRAFIMGKAGA